ncbi:MAG: serine hydrolase [Bacteroidota bacterium]
MRILTFLIVSLVIFSGSAQSKTKQEFLQERIKRIENGLQSNLQIQYGDSVVIKQYHIEDRMKELKITGLSIAVLNNGVIEWAKGYGMADSLQNRKVTTETLFQAGSISKAIAATRALQLVEDGTIGLDLNVNNYLSGWTLPDNEFTKEEKVTTRRLLNHSAGLTVHGFPGYSFKDTIPSVIEVLNGKGNTDPVRVFREPGEKVGYSGGGYTVLQLMIADIEQRDFSEIMNEKVLTPLGMRSSTYKNPLPKKYHGLAAAGYYSNGAQVEGKWHTYPEMAAAGLWTTPSQLLLWAKEMQQTLQTQKDGFLKVETVNEMLTDYGNNQGLGPYVVDHIFGHGGADEGFRSDLRIWKDHSISVAIMVNSDNGSAIISELFLSLAEEYQLPGIYNRVRKVNEQTKKELSRFVGRYNFEKYGDAEIRIKDNGLEFNGAIFSGNAVFLLPQSDTTFFNKKTGTYYEFQLEKNAVNGVVFSRYKAQKIE